MFSSPSPWSRRGRGRPTPSPPEPDAGVTTVAVGLVGRRSTPTQRHCVGYRHRITLAVVDRHVPGHPQRPAGDQDHLPRRRGTVSSVAGHEVARTPTIGATRSAAIGAVGCCAHDRALGPRRTSSRRRTVEAEVAVGPIAKGRCRRRTASAEGVGLGTVGQPLERAPRGRSVAPRRSSVVLARRRFSGHQWHPGDQVGPVDPNAHPHGSHPTAAVPQPELVGPRTPPLAAPTPGLSEQRATGTGDGSARQDTGDGAAGGSAPSGAGPVP
jgi:hypothetical protein